MLKPEYRLKSSKEFGIIYKKGRKIRGQFGMLISLPTASHTSNHPFQRNQTDINPPTSKPQFGLVVSKKVGNAVERHRVSRQLRNLIHELMPDFEKKLLGMKFSYIAFKGSDSFTQLKDEFKKQIVEAVSESQ